MKERLFVFGSSGHASVVIDAIERGKQYEIAGLIDTFSKPGHEVLGYTVLGGEDQMTDFAAQYGANKIAVAVGDNWNRAAIVSRLQAVLPSIGFPPIIHPSAEIARSVTIG